MNPVSKLIHTFIKPPYFDKWTSIHILCGLFIAKVSLWLGCTDLMAVLWVFIIGMSWEVMEWFVEDGWKPYGTMDNYVKNTISDVVLETGVAVWLVI